MLYIGYCTVIVWFPDPSSGGEREGSGELPAACVDLWHFNLMNETECDWSVTAPNFKILIFYRIF